MILENIRKLITYLSIVLILALSNISIMFYFLPNQNFQIDVPNIIDFGIIFLSLILIASLVIVIHYLLSKELFIRIIVGYVIYIFISKILLVTQNINNPRFKLIDVFGSNFIDLNGLIFLLTIFLLAFFLFKMRKKIHFVLFDILDTFEFKIITIDIISSIMLMIVIVLDSNVLHTIRSIYGNGINGYNDFISILGLSVFLSIGLFGSTLISYRSYYSIISNRGSVEISFVTSIILAIIFNFILQYSIKADDSLLGYYIFPGASLYQIILLSIFFMIHFFIINRYILSVISIIITWGGLALINSIKFSMRNEPLLISDFVWLIQFITVIKFVNIKYIFYAILFLIVTSVIYFFTRNKFLSNKLFSNMTHRLNYLLFTLFLLLGIWGIFRSEDNKKVFSGVPIISILNNKIDINWMGTTANARYKSLLFVWSKQITQKIMEQPSGYSRQTLRQIEEKYSNISEEINKDRKALIEDQTIIYILSESLSNPNSLDGVSITEDIFSNINNIKKVTTSGTMISEGYGGGTANMEFQTLTGLPYRFMSPTVSTIYTQVVPKMKRLPSISDYFDKDQRIFIHPAEISNYSRGEIYSRLQFEKLLSIEDRSLKFNNEGINPSDKSVYDLILNNLDKKKSQFFSIVTMQNHAPWSSGSPENISGRGAGFTLEQNETLSSYARLLSVSDKEINNFLNELSKKDKKITVVFYGDHLPGFYPQEIFKDNPESQYLTDFFIWSNYDAGKLEDSKIYSSDFIAHLFEHTDSKVSPYYALLTSYLESKKVNQEEIVEDLKMVEYDLISGKGYLTDNFFNTK